MDLTFVSVLQNTVYDHRHIFVTSILLGGIPYDTQIFSSVVNERNELDPDSSSLYT